MTDRLDCPDCGGTGEARFGALVTQCEFCRGAGYVGDDNEPAEEHPPGDPPPVWDQVGADTRRCRTCLGTGIVIHLAGGEPASQLGSASCPDCR